jgi:O-antigen ligase
MLYIPGIGSFPPVVALLGGLLALTTLQLRTAPPTAAWIAFALSLVCVASLLYSSDRNAALSAALLFAEIGGLIAVGARMVAWPRIVWRTVAAWVVVASSDAILVVFFRLVPAAEITWFQSSVARFFIAGGTLDTLFSTATNNALAPDKSGAFFPNANAGSAMLGVGFVMCTALARRTRHRRWHLMGVVFAAGVVASGSTAGLALLGASLLVLVIARLRNRFMAGTVAVVLTGLLAGAALSLSQQATSSIDVITRGLLWALAVSAIRLHPLLGLGFGGWSVYAGGSFGLIGGSDNYPPHNLLLYTWIQMGLAGFVLTVAFFVATFIGLRRSTSDARGLVALAVAWTFLHAMADNTSIFNDFHSAAPLGLMVGMMIAARQGQIDPSDEVRLTRQARRTVQRSSPLIRRHA